MELLTVNLERKLIQENKKLVNPEELLVIQEYSKYSNLLSDKTLSRIRLNSNIVQGHHLTHALLRKRKETESFNQRRVFHISQIEAICNKYYLRFLPSHLYKGTIDNELPLKVTTFEVAHMVKCGRYNTFIVAPKESFKLQEKDKDPLFFYQINEDYYYLIHKWGSDLSILRMLYALLTNMYFSYFVICFLLPSIFLLNWQNKGVELFTIASLVLNAFCLIANGLYKYSDEIPLRVRLLKRNEWNSRFKD